MKFSCTQENLNWGLNVLSHLATKNVSLPILNNILIKTKEGGLALSATNLEIGITCRIRGKIEEEGEFTVPANLLTNYISLLGETRIDVSTEGKELIILTANQKTKIKGEEASEFPVIPEVAKTNEYICEHESFKNALTKVAFAASLDDTRPEIAGILFNFTEHHLILAATDSYRLAEKKISLVQGKESTMVIVPQRTTTEILRILGFLQEKEIKIYLSENQLLLSGENVEIVSRLIEGNYPAYQQIIPKTSRTEAKINKDDLIKLIKTASLFSKTGINDVHLFFSTEKQKITISAVNNQLGENITEFNVHLSGEDNDIVFNYRYLLDGLTSLEGEEILIKIIDNANPGVFLSPKEENHLYLVMPIRQ